jgi:hypothetical protein
MDVTQQPLLSSHPHFVADDIYAAADFAAADSALPEFQGGEQ